MPQDPNNAQAFGIHAVAHLYVCQLVLVRHRETTEEQRSGKFPPTVLYLHCILDRLLFGVRFRFAAWCFARCRVVL